MTTIIARRKSDGTLVKVNLGGTEILLDASGEERNLSEDEIMAAAMTDPDNPPSDPARPSRPRRLAGAKRLRWQLKLSREEFAARYPIPVDLLAAWERRHAEPDAVASAYCGHRG